MFEDLAGKTALITGSGKRTGIGYAIADRLCRSGMNVVIADLGSEPQARTAIPCGTWEEMRGIAEDLHHRYGVETLPVSLDVTDNRSIADMMRKVKEHFPHLDVLCNNAGASFGVPNAVHTYNEEAWMKTIDVNLHGVFRVSRAALPLMRGRKASVINTASRAGKVPPLFNGAYAVAKAGVIMLTKVMAKELAAQGIRVNAVCPGQIMTDLEKWRFDLEAEYRYYLSLALLFLYTGLRPGKILHFT